VKSGDRVLLRIEECLIAEENLALLVMGANLKELREVKPIKCQDLMTIQLKNQNLRVFETTF